MADIDVKFDPISVTTGPTTVTVAGLNDIKIAFTEPIETKSSLTLSVPDTIKTDATAKLTTDSKIATDSKVATDSRVATDSKLALVLPDPIRTESKAALDLQPVVLDQCLKLSLGALPLTHVCLPNRQRIGFTLFGMEVFGLTLDGETQFVIGDPPKQPQVVAAPVNHPPHASPVHHETHASIDHAVAHSGHGLVVRLGP